MKSILIIALLLASPDLLAQSKIHTKLTREVSITNPLLMSELKKVISSNERNVYVCHVIKEKDKSYCKLTEIGYVSELKNEPSSLYSIINKSVVFIQTGIDDFLDNNDFFLNVALPLTKGLIINDLLPDGSINKETLPYAGYDPIDIIIVLEKNKITVTQESRH